MGKIFIAIAALVILGGGGAGAYFYFFQSAEASVPEGEEHEVAKEDDGEHVELGTEFVELPPLILPIVDGNGVHQVVSLVVALDVSGTDAADEVRAMMPKLQDAFIQDMYGVLNRHAAFKGGVIQVNVIKARLNRISKQVLGEDKVNEVLLQVVQQRPI